MGRFADRPDYPTRLLVLIHPSACKGESPNFARAKNEAGRRTRRGPGPKPRPLFAPPSERLALRVVGPYLAVDLPDEGLAVLVALLELAHLPQLLGGEALQPLGDLRDGQPLVVLGLERAQDGGPELRLPGGLLGPAEHLVGPLRGLLGDPQPPPGDLLGGLQPLPRGLPGGLQPLPGGPLEGPHALPHVGEGREEAPVRPRPPLGERPQALLLLAHAPREGLGGARVVLGLLAQGVYGVARPALGELGVALLEPEQPDAVGEPLPGRPGVVLLQPHELQPAVGQPRGAALGGGEVLAHGLVGLALGLGHLAGGARALVYVRGDRHRDTSVVVGASIFLLHLYPNSTLRNIQPPGSRRTFFYVLLRHRRRVSFFRPSERN